MKTESLTQEVLKELLNYDPETGYFVWRVNRSGSAKAGSAAGSLNSKGYRTISVFGREHKAHRLAMLWMNGAWPDGQVDHINGRKDDNRWANLRDADGFLNQQNIRKARARNRVGMLGVHQQNGKFVAQIWSEGRLKYLGRFGAAEDAHAAYLLAKRELHQGCTI